MNKDFLQKGNYFIDDEWWYRQRDRCLNGYEVPNAVVKGGDVFLDGIECFWHGKDLEIPLYDLVFRDSTVWISGRMYFYLNFWPIYGVKKGIVSKTLVHPRFLSLDFFYFYRLVMMFLQKKDGQDVKGRQIGYELPNSEPVLTINGWRKNGDLKIGDKIATRKGTYSPVVNIYPQGIKDVYEMELMDGRKIRCGLKHRWTVYDKGLKKPREKVLTTEEIINFKLYWNCNGGKNVAYRFALPDIEPIPFDENKELFIDPYLLGLLLGDGSLGAAVRLATDDVEIVDYVSNILGKDYTLKRDLTNNNYAIVYYGPRTMVMKKKYGLKSVINKFNVLRQELNLLGLIGTHSYDKFIPDIYKHSLIKQRIELVRGLLDSDGHISPDGKIEFKVVSKQLADDLAYVLRSLGVKVLISSFESKKGYRVYYRVYIKLTHFNPFRLKRKAERFNPNREMYKRVPIIKITKLDYQEESTCIEIKDSDHVYLMKDFVPTHNSEKGAGGIMGYNFTFLSDSINIIVAGIQEDSDHTMERTIIGLDSIANTQFYKERKRGGDSSTKLISKNTGAEIRSLTAKDSPTAVSRFSPFFVLYEEIGKGKKEWSLEVAKYVLPSIETEGVKTGWQLFGGTAGEMNDGVYDLEIRHYNPKDHNILDFPNIFDKDELNSDVRVGHFTGKDQYYIVDEDGNAMRQKSRGEILKRREEKKPKDKYKFITQLPVYASECFLTTSIGFFGEYIVQLLNERKALLQIRSEYRIVRKGRLDPKDPAKPFDGMVWSSDEADGWLQIIEEPEVDEEGHPYINLYKAGVDSYDQDEAHTTNSKGSMHIKKTYNPYIKSAFFNMTVAQIIERPLPEQGGAPTFYKHTAYVCIWYGCQMNIEYANLRIFQWLEDHGFQSLLKERPQLAFAGKILNTQVSNRYGTDRSLKPHILAELADVLTEAYISRMFFLEQVIALSKYKYDPSGKKYNCDITISTAEMEISAKEDILLPVNSRGEMEKKLKENRGYRVFVTGRNGELVSTTV